MDLEFSIVLFENEGYATARGNKGVQDILAAKAEAGYVKGSTFPIIFTLHPYCWKWWIRPKQEEMNFSMFTPRFLAGQTFMEKTNLSSNG